MPKRKVADSAIDPTLPSTPVMIGDKEYRLCFDLAALAEAESHFNTQGHEVNLLRELPVLNLSSISVIFPCAIHKFHPEIAFEDAQKLITFPILYVIAGAVTDAWSKSVPEPENNEERPSQPE